MSQFKVLSLFLIVVFIPKCRKKKIPKFQNFTNYEIVFCCELLKIFLNFEESLQIISRRLKTEF